MISIDLLLVAFATLLAFLLRENFYLVQGKLIALIPYILICLASASIVFFVGGLDRTPWRYSSLADQLQIIVLTALLILLALLLTFTVNRLDGVARSLPVLQGILIVATLVAARAAFRFWFARRTRIPSNGRIEGHLHETVLVAGVNAVSELFLRCVQELASHQIEVAGILAEEPTMRGRVVQQKPVLGTVQEVQSILQSLEVHGVGVNRIVVAVPADQLSPRALEALLEVEKSSDIAVQFLSERLGLEGRAPDTLSLFGWRTQHGLWAKSACSGWCDISCEFRRKIVSDSKANDRLLGCSIFHHHAGTFLNARCSGCCIGYRFSSDILAATTRFIWTAIQAVQISNDVCCARQTFETDP